MQRIPSVASAGCFFLSCVFAERMATKRSFFSTEARYPKIRNNMSGIYIYNLRNSPWWKWQKLQAVKEHRSEITVAVNRLWSCWGSIYCFQSWSPQGGKRSFFPANKRSTPGARNPTSFCPKECRWSLHWPCEKDEFHSRKTEMEILKKKIIQPIKNWISKVIWKGSTFVASSGWFSTLPGCSLPRKLHLQLEDGCSRLVTQFKGLSGLIQFAALKISWKGEVKALHSLEKKSTGGTSDQVESWSKEFWTENTWKFSLQTK